MRKSVIISIVIPFLCIIRLLAQEKLDSSLVNELERMIIIDQLAATNSRPEGHSSALSMSEWKDSIYRAHQSRLEKILNKHSYPGYDLVGKRGSQLFWTMVQHSDFEPDFQKRVLDSMRIEVINKNANAHNYAFLTDRVKKNFNEKLFYGTQVTYHWFTGKAQPLPTIDPENLNKRRAEIGLEPIEDYLKEMTQLNNSQGNSVTGGITNLALLLIVAVLTVSALVVVFLLKKKKAIDNRVDGR